MIQVQLVHRPSIDTGRHVISNASQICGHLYYYILFAELCHFTYLLRGLLQTWNIRVPITRTHRAHTHTFTHVHLTVALMIADRADCHRNKISVYTIYHSAWVEGNCTTGARHSLWRASVTLARCAVSRAERSLSNERQNSEWEAQIASSTLTSN